MLIHSNPTEFVNSIEDKEAGSGTGGGTGNRGEEEREEVPSLRSFHNTMKDAHTCLFRQE